MLRTIAAVSLALTLPLALPGRAAVGSGLYQTVPGAMVLEKGDYVPSHSRLVPLFATVRLDFNSAPPSLTGAITNAVLEGGAPFALTVTNSSWYPWTDGSYNFHGYYLAGTQYLFDWRFSMSTNGEVLWNGYDYWTGGHIWQVPISNITMVPLPWLDIARVGPASVNITWSTNLADSVLESISSLSTPGWGAVTNVPIIAGDQFSVTLDPSGSSRFFRLRKL